MSDTIIVAALSLLGTIITVWAANRHTLAELDKKSELSDAKIDAKLERHQAVTDTKIEELTRQVEKHNSMIERTYKLEGRMNEAEHDIRDLKERVRE
jgi:peptidoglycan hydrolase CwlO-like protein